MASSLQEILAQGILRKSSVDEFITQPDDAHLSSGPPTCSGRSDVRSWILSADPTLGETGARVADWWKKVGQRDFLAAIGHSVRG